ncbi:MAG: ABC transporter ATP-binding protein [Deltaproteobacteria bacterium]|nr:ABC transporter ATP-binding protein [Deltaproteobacteria bacterium]
MKPSDSSPIKPESGSNYKHKPVGNLVRPTLWQQLAGLIRPYVPRVILATLFSIIVSGLNGAIAWLVKPAMDKIFVEGNYKYIYLLPLGIIILYILRGACSFLQSYLMRTAGMKLVRDLRNRFFSHLIRLPVSVISRSSSGDMLSRLMNDVGAMGNFLSESLRTFLLQIPSVIVLMGVALYQRWDLALLSFILLPFIALGTRFLSKLARIRRKKVQRYLAILTHRVSEALQGLRVVKIFGMEKVKDSQFVKENQTTYRQMSKAIRLREGTKFLIEVLSGLAVAAILGYGGSLVASGEMTSGAFFSIITAIVMAFTPFKKLGGAYTQFQETLGIFERVNHFLDQKQEESQGQALDGLRKEIRYENVSFSYPGTDSQVLQAIDIIIPAGKIFAIVGPSGAGKSTLVDLIPRFYNPTSGRILWDGIDLRKISLADLRHQMAIVTQDVVLFSDTIYENIAAGRPDGATMEDVEKAAKVAQAHDFIAALPQGYDSVLDERGLNLSGGQRQRIALARAVLRNPPLLILDEATSALDSVSEKAIQEALDKVMKGRTTIVIAHRLSTIIHADQVVVIDQGRIVDRGTHKELIESSALYRELYQTWASSDQKIVKD